MVRRDLGVPETARGGGAFASHAFLVQAQRRLLVVAIAEHRVASSGGETRDRSGELEDLLESITLLLPAASTFQVAARLAPANLRSLDALHVASALELGAVQGIVTYDARVVGGAEAASVVVISPSAGGRRNRA